MALRDYVARRLVHLVFVFWVFFTILFVMFRTIPGDPTAFYVQQGMDPDQRQKMIERLGLNDPLHEQYFDYIGQLLTGEFGTSFVHNTEVSTILINRFQNTVVLMGTGLIIAYALAMILGSLLAWWRGTDRERLGILVALVFRSTPQFWLGIALIIIFTFTLGWFPSGGLRSVGSDPQGTLATYISTDFLYHLFLPVLTVVIYYMAAPTLLMRTSMMKILNADFIEIKKAEGLPPSNIIYKHAARNSLLPLVTLAAVVSSTMFGGAVVIETVFSWPGMGREMVKAVRLSDYPVAMATFFIMGSIVILMNFVADLLYAYLDPRVVYE